MPPKPSKKTRQAINEIRSVATRALEDASREGFNGLQNGRTLCQKRSKSENINELKVDLAARQIEHCLESWNFLSQSTWALLTNQEKQATHMAYYSEIRAANSLLAASGIAEENTDSYFIEKDNKRSAIKARTHSFIKEVWPNWSKRNDAVEAFEQLIVAQTITLKDVAQALFLSSLSGSQTINHWGYELTKFHNDRNARNKASYQTSLAYEGIPKISGKQYCKIVSLAWDHLQPGGADGQMQLEIIYAQYLVHASCLDKAKDNKTPIQKAYSKELNSFLDRLHQNTGTNRDFLVRLFPLSHDYNDTRFELFELAGKKQTSPENIYCRAVILTRLATNKLRINLDATGATPALKWIELWLQEAGIIGENESPNEALTYVDSFINAAEEIRDLNLRDIWSNEGHAHKASIACRINSGLCWSLPCQT